MVKARIYDFPLSPDRQMELFYEKEEEYYYQPKPQIEKKEAINNLGNLIRKFFTY